MITNSRLYKTIGILGGMGPAATVDLMNKIIEMTAAEADQDHIPMLVDSNTRIPDRTAAILHGGESPVEEMLLSARRLSAAGADFIIMPCNTAHYFKSSLEAEVDIPFLDMTCETAGLLARRGVKKAAVLATDGTVQSGMYEKALAEQGIVTLYPDKRQQRLVMHLIYDCIKKGITDKDSLPVSGTREMADSLYSEGAQTLVLACTELPLAFNIMGLEDENCVDPTRILAGAAIRKAGAEVRSGSGY